MLNRLRDLLIDGVLLALPLGAAAYLLHKVVAALLELLAPVSHLLPQGHYFCIAALDIAAIALLAAALIVLGALARSAPGRWVRHTVEDVVLSKIPGYMVIRSIAADMSSAQSDSGMRAALVSFDDNTMLGFVTEEVADTLTVFLPDAPGATSGGVVLVSRERVKLLDVATGSALRTMKQRGLGLQLLSKA